MTGRKYVKNVFSPLLGFFSLSFVTHCIKLPYHLTMRKCFHPVKERPNPHRLIKGWVVWPEIPDLDMRECQLWDLCFGLAFICLVVMVWGRETDTFLLPNPALPAGNWEEQLVPLPALHFPSPWTGESSRTLLSCTGAPSVKEWGNIWQPLTLSHRNRARNLLTSSDVLSRQYIFLVSPSGCSFTICVTTY